MCRPLHVPDESLPTTTSNHQLLPATTNYYQLLPTTATCYHQLLLQVPDELSLSAADVPAVVRRGRQADVPLLQQAYVAIDLDRLDLVIEY